MKKNLKILFLVLGTLLAMVFVLFVYFNLPGPAPRQDAELGVTFSSRYATDLGLDWRETYLALLDEMGVRNIRLPVYWDLIERERSSYDFEALDWQIAEAEKRGASLILVLGQRVPRWPECHIPGWAHEDTELRQAALLQFMMEVVNRYRHSEAVKTWQVENEPFLVFFGNCPPFDSIFFDQEIALVKALNPGRPVLTTDSGELSLWLRAAKRGDIFGTTMYRKLWHENFGYFTYPVGPNFFRFKAWLVRAFTDQENFIVIELQSEPWARGWIGNVSLEEQFLTMDERRLRENVEYARRVGFPEIYLWGGEWWYWLKVKHDYPALWNTARELFQNSNNGS